MVVYRQANFGSPLRAVPSRLPGRYHSSRDASPTQYLCLHPLGPLAEFMRNNSTRQPEQVLQIHARTWALRVDVDDLPQITFDSASDFGLASHDLVADDQGRCREVAAELRAGGIRGIVVPSAALPGTSNVVIFGPRVGSPYLFDAVGEVDVPASITAHAGRPIVSLLDRVRFVGEPHAAFEAWTAGETFAFDEPDWEISTEPS
jgi:RES domain-containing protein